MPRHSKEDERDAVRVLVLIFLGVVVREASLKSQDVFCSVRSFRFSPTGALVIRRAVDAGDPLPGGAGNIQKTRR